MRGPQRNLFSTAILQSGTVPICGLYTEEEYHVFYIKLVKACGVNVDLPPAERLAALRAVPHEVLSQNTYEVFQALNLPQFGPCFDGHVLGAGVDIPRPGWYKDGKIADTGYKGRVVLGDCMREFYLAFSASSPRYRSCSARLGSPAGSALSRSLVDALPRSLLRRRHHLRSSLP